MSLDGRLAKGEKTRDSILLACIELIDGEPTVPTLAQVAERAGYSVRLIHYHFQGIPRLLLAAVELQVERHRSQLFVIPNKVRLAKRIEVLSRQRRLYFEDMGGAYRVAGVAVRSHPGFERLLVSQRAILRKQLACSFAPELSVPDTDSSGLLAMLEQASGWDTWKSLRDSCDHSALSAERVMIHHVTRILC